MNKKNIKNTMVTQKKELSDNIIPSCEQKFCLTACFVLKVDCICNVLSMV